MILSIPRRAKFEVGSLEEASELYCRERDESCEGASTFPFGKVYVKKKLVATISYNGRIWKEEAA